MSAPASARTVITIEGDVQVRLPNAEPVPPSQSETHKLAYSVDQVAELTGISDSKIREYIATGELTARKNGRHILILPAELDAFLTALPLYGREG